jgi:hypothetical protein
MPRYRIIPVEPYRRWQPQQRVWLFFWRDMFDAARTAEQAATAIRNVQLVRGER